MWGSLTVSYDYHMNSVTLSEANIQQSHIDIMSNLSDSIQFSVDTLASSFQSPSYDHASSVNEELLNSQFASEVGL